VAVVFGLLYAVAFMASDAYVSGDAYLLARRYGYGWSSGPAGVVNPAPADGGPYLLTVATDGPLVTVDTRVDTQAGAVYSSMPVAQLLELTHLTLVSDYSGANRTLTVAVSSVTREASGASLYPTAVFVTPLGSVALSGPDVSTDSPRVLALLGMPTQARRLAEAQLSRVAVSADGGPVAAGAGRLLADSGPRVLLPAGTGTGGFYQLDVTGADLPLPDVPTPSPTTSGTPSKTPFASSSRSASAAATSSRSVSPPPSTSRSSSPTASMTATASPTGTVSTSVSASWSSSVSLSASATPSGTASETPSATASVSRSASASETATPTVSRTATATASGSLTGSITVSTSLSSSETATPTASLSATATASLSGSNTQSGSQSLSATPTASVTPSATPSATPSQSASGTGSGSKTASTSLSASATPSPTPSGSRTPSASVTASVTPTASLTPSVTPTATLTPSVTPMPQCGGLVYRGFLAPASTAGPLTAGWSGLVALGNANAGAPSTFACPGDDPPGAGTATDFYVVDVGAGRTPGGTLTVSTCDSTPSTGFDSVVFVGAGCGAGGAGFACAASSDDSCGIGSRVVLTGVTGRFFQVGVAGFAGVGGSYNLTYVYSEPVTPSITPSTSPTRSPSPTNTPSASRTASDSGSGSPTAPPTPSSTGTGSLTASPTASQTAASTGTATATGSVTPPVTPSSSVTPSQSPSAAPTPSGTPIPACPEPGTGAPYPFRGNLLGTAGATPPRINGASNWTAVVCDGVVRPYWLSPSPSDVYVLDLGVET
jgi:hypothetical protein